MMNGLARFAVPLFFLVSGYFCYGKGMDTVKRRIRNTGHLFLLANGVYFLWKLAALAEKDALTLAAAAELFAPKALFDWLVWNQSPFMGHLWFLGALLYCYLLYALLVKKGWQEKLYGLIPLCLAANVLLGEILPILGRENNFLHTRNFWLTGLPFFLLGHWFAKREKSGALRVHTLVCLAGIGVGTVMSMAEMLMTGGGELYIGSIFMVCGLFLLALQNPGWGEGSLLAHIGARDSLHIYLWQMIVFDVAEKLAHAGGFGEHMIYQWLLPLIVCLLSWLLAEAIEKGKEYRYGKN